jgi:hypothetical protein
MQKSKGKKQDKKWEKPLITETELNPAETLFSCCKGLGCMPAQCTPQATCPPMGLGNS